MAIKLETPLTVEKALRLKAGDRVLLSGVIYSARDAAHKRLCEALSRGEALPLDIRDQIFYYVGPSPAPPGRVIGSAGPTTANRMDKYAPLLLDHGLRGMIAKGNRSRSVVESIVKNKAVYFVAIGGAGVYLANRIVKVEPVAYEDLGTEAIRKLTVEEFPVIVAIDCEGRNQYELSRQDAVSVK